MNNKGFTLVELIVTIAIMAVITLIAYPAIAKLQENNKAQAYKEYEKSLEGAAKVYVQKYSRDLFYNKTCITVTQEKLKEEELIKDLNDKGSVCTGMIVKVTKSNAGYEYEVGITCKKNSEIVYEKNIPGC